MNTHKISRCLFTGHIWKHYRIVKVSEFDDDRGGPANRFVETIQRKCLNCDKRWTEILTND